MATTTTRQLREPFVEAAGLGVTNEGLRLLKQTLPTATYTGSQFVAGQSQLEKDAAKAAADLGQLTGTGVGTAQQAGSIASYMSPYQEQVIDASLAALDREQAKGLGALRNRAVQAGAFGSGREAALMGEYQASADVARAVQEAQLRQQGFTQANQLANQAFGQQMNMGSQAMNQAQQNVGLFGQAGQAQAGLGQAQNQQFAQQFGQLGGLSAAQQQLGEYGGSMLGNQINALTQMGQQNQAFQQALLDARQNQLQQSAFAPQQGLGFLSQMLGAAYGAPGGTTFQTTPQPSTLETLLGAGTGIIGILGATGAFDKDEN